MSSINGATIRQTMLEALAECERRLAELGLTSSEVLTEAAVRLNVGPRSDQGLQRAILAYWHDLVRSGHVAWGSDLLNANPPYCHLTERGKETLRHLSRDPMNPAGYMEYLTQKAHVGPIATAYVEEALQTYGASCYKATAVMIGAAA